MGYRVPYMAELVFVLVGAYFVSIPFLRHVPQPQGNLPLPLEKAEERAAAILLVVRAHEREKPQYVLYEEKTSCANLDALSLAFDRIATRKPRPQIRVQAPEDMPAGFVLDVYNLCGARGLKVIHPGGPGDQP